MTSEHPAIKWKTKTYESECLPNVKLTHATVKEYNEPKWKNTTENCKNTDVISFQSKERREDPRQKKANQEKTKLKAVGGTLEVASLLLEKNCPELVFVKPKPPKTYRHVHTGDDCYVAKVAGLQVLGANAGAGVTSTLATTKLTAIEASATARVAGPEAQANAILLQGVIEANAKAVSEEASATAGVGLENLGAKAEANAVVGKVSAGIKHTPLKVHAQGPGANAEVGVSLDYTGANVGASLGEARAGPFAARAGVKFGAGIRNGVPEVDLGPITVPCSIM